MTPAEKRIKELLDRWLTSIELHLQYTNLSDEAYWNMQAWPKHDRPTRWVLESAKQKANELKDVFESRHAMGDSKFAEALELMNFLANLVGAQHVDRFVPLAEPQDETAMPVAPARTVSTPPAPPTSDMPSWYIQAAQSAAPAPRPTVTTPPRATQPRVEPTPRLESAPEATREMPKFRGQPQAVAPPPPPPPPRPPPPKPEPRKIAPAKQAASKAAAAPNAVQQTVMNDAVRLLGWGRTWHELADLIARMADRPPIGEIRKILRTFRPAIEKAAKESKQ